MDHGDSPRSLEIRYWTMVASHYPQKLNSGQWWIPTFTRGQVGHPCAARGHKRLDSGIWCFVTVTTDQVVDLVAPHCTRVQIVDHACFPLSFEAR